MHCGFSCKASQGCLGGNQKKDVLNTILAREGPPAEGEPRRKAIRIDESATFVCSRCNNDPRCFVCVAGKVESKGKKTSVEGAKAGSGDGGTMVGDDEPLEVSGRDEQGEETDDATLLFRCWRCKQAAHYPCRECGHSREKAEKLDVLITAQ